MGADSTVEKIVLFDGVCNLCSSSVQFIIKKNRKHNLRFASLQCDFGQKLLNQFQVENNLKTIVYFQSGKLFTRSDAVLEIMRELKGLWPLFYFFKIIPRFIRDFVYDFISRNRYRWFGKLNECWLPSPDLNERFIS